MTSFPDEISNDCGERIDVSLHAGEPGRRDLVVLGHGVTGNKDRPFLVALAQALADKGIAALRISFSGNGNSQGEFSASTITKEVADLGHVLDTLDGWNIAYVGHSMGGAVGVIRASQDPRIRLLVSLAGMVHTQDFAQRKFGESTPGQDCMWDKPDCPLSQAYMDDMASIATVVEHGSGITVPWFLVHGTEDTVVPLQDSLDILERARNTAELSELAGADHVFTDDATPRMVEKVSEWLCKGFD